MRRTLYSDNAYRRWLAVAVLAFLIIAPVAAGGRPETDASEETPSAPPGSGPDTSPPTTAGQSEDTASSDRIPMDDTTAAILKRIGLMPFSERIPSEDFGLPLLSGGESRLSDHLGKVVFLNFWATWCPPCREEMPSMQKLHDALAADGLEILAVNVLESADTARSFVEEQGFTYPILLDLQGRVMLRYGVRAYPTTFLIDRNGYVLGIRPGYQDWNSEAIVGALRELLDSE